MKLTKYITLPLFLLFLVFITPGTFSQEKEMKVDPHDILSVWTYEDVIKTFGEGENIIDSMSGQAYIAGFRYKDLWFERECEMEFYFSDVDVSSFLLRFNHPNNAILEIEDEKRKELALQNSQKSSKETDSLLLERLRNNTKFFDSVAYKRELDYRMDLLEKDSLRNDSIIRDISEILGQPLREGGTQHTEKDSRYFATWIKNGYSCSLKDFRQFTLINFSISPAPGAAIANFSIDKGTKLIEKRKVQVRDEVVEVSLLGLPNEKGSNTYRELNVLATAENGNMYLERLPEERQSGYKPRIRSIDLTGDNIDEIWIQAEAAPNSNCVLNFIFTMELIEPLLIFDPMEDFYMSLEGEFQDDFQAMILIDGYPRSYVPLDKSNPLYDNIFDSNGKLLKPVTLRAGCLEQLEAKAYTSKKGFQFIGYMPIYGLSEEDTIGHIQAIWDYNMGGWELRSLEISKN